MITQEIFKYFQKIKANTDYPIIQEEFLPIRDKISIADASNYTLEDNEGQEFWNFFDSLIDQKLIKSVYYIMEDFWTKKNNDENDEELFESSEDAYLKYIIFRTDLSKNEVESKIINTLNKKFNAECFVNSELGKDTWYITWD